MQSKNNHLAVIFLGVVALVPALGGCTQSAQNLELKSSQMSMEDARFYPSDEYVRLGKVGYKNGDYGLAALNFRKAVEAEPKDVEAWVGLAAAYDGLRRFDLADQAYMQVTRLASDNAIILNNAGYSQLMRGDTERARRFFLRAHELAPDNEIINNNLALLGETKTKIKRIPL